jgi:hypothetical protein
VQLGQFSSETLCTYKWSGYTPNFFMRRDITTVMHDKKGFVTDKKFLSGYFVIFFFFQIVSHDFGLRRLLFLLKFSSQFFQM